MTIHEQKLGLLVNDLVGIPIGPLEKAVAAWVKRSHYMPKASELIALAQESIAEPTKAARATESLDELCQRYNDHCIARKSQMRFRLIDGQLEYFDANDLNR